MILMVKIAFYRIILILFLEPVPEVAIKPITGEEEEERAVEEPSIVYEDEEAVAEEPSVVVEEEEAVAEPEEEVLSRNNQNKQELPSSFDYFGNYDEDEEIVGTLD